ncbi:MAG TPA: AAA family ATPase [Methanosarcina sp.]|jgi:hypothetical protein
MISSIKIKGFRGFAEEQELKLSKPNGKKGSGLTVIVGPNNGGKSTIIESFKAMSLGTDISFAEGQRNEEAGSVVEIVLSSESGSIQSLETILAGGHKAKRNPGPEYGNYHPYDPSIIVLSSRRFFDPYSKEASHGAGDLFAARPDSITLNTRGQPIDADDNKLFKIIEDPKSIEEFNSLLKQILGYKLDWTVDLSNTGNYYVKITNNGYHDSDGLGEGLVSLLFIVAALLNSSPNKLLVIDEPELSLHPQLQRNLLDIILEKSRDHQILYATHSPEMVSIDAILNGGTLARVVNSGNGSKIYQLELNREITNFLKGTTKNRNNPHILAYDARSCFFADDRSAGLIIVEGQEDVVLLDKAVNLLEIKNKILFFGFGAGGAENIRHIATILSSLGFERICCLYDGDKVEECKNTRKELSKEGNLFKKRCLKCGFKVLPADDIRDKECPFHDKCINIINGDNCKSCEYKNETPESCASNKCGNIKDIQVCEKCKYMKIGIFNNKGKIKSDYEPKFKDLLNEIATEYGYEGYLLELARGYAKYP